MNSFPTEDVLAACAQFGPLLVVPEGLDGRRVMAAIASNESSTGRNCGPRHEPAYDEGGEVYKDSPEQQRLVAQYGNSAACSYGPWQCMFINCPGYTPGELQINLTDCARAFVSYFNSYVMRAKKAQSLNQIGQIYNSGHVSGAPSASVQTYCNRLQTAYDALTANMMHLFTT